MLVLGGNTGAVVNNRWVPAAVNSRRVSQRQLTTTRGNIVISMCQLEVFFVKKAIFGYICQASG